MLEKNWLKRGNILRIVQKTRLLVKMTYFFLYFKDIQLLNILVKTIRLRLSRIFYVHISYLLKNAIYIDNMTRGRCGLHLDFQNGNGALFVNVCVWLERIDMTLFATPAAKSSSSPKVFP